MQELKNFQIRISLIYIFVYRNHLLKYLFCEVILVLCLCNGAHENTYVRQLFIYVVRLMKILMYSNYLYMQYMLIKKLFIFVVYGNDKVIFNVGSYSILVFSKAM